MLLEQSRTALPSDERLVTLVRPRSFEADQFRRLRQRIEELSVSRGLRVVAVTSAVASDGKTFTSINLAGALAARAGAKVLLIDADLRRPSVAATLNLDPKTPGLVAALESGHGDLGRYVQRVTAATTIDVLPCETTQSDTYELLTSPAFQALTADARYAYDFVVIDTPPIIPVPDTGLLGPAVDGYLVVVAANVTPRKLVGEALNLLEPSTVLGLVFNRDDRPLFGYYKSSYRQYFRSYVQSLDRVDGDS